MKQKYNKKYKSINSTGQQCSGTGNSGNVEQVLLYDFYMILINF